MKLINTLHRLKIRFLTKLPSNDIYLKLFAPIGILILVSAGIWISGPYLSWADYTPLAQADKRIYVILFLFLIWLLKFLIIDLDTPSPSQHKDALTQKKLQNLQSRFQGALQFLKKTTVTRQNNIKSLNQLPWYLLIGPASAGKTSLLANSNVNFILQRQFANQDKQHVEASENCDWWITRDASIIDVPGKYLLSHHDQKPLIYPVLWNFFLRLIKKQRGKNGISGIVIALPLPEIMKQGDTKRYHSLLRDLFQRLHEIQKTFPRPIPCQLVITKCDLLSGFTEFFAESGNDEITQAWGVTLPESKQGEKAHDIFAQRFNALIKRLNQQLLWRLHQERNPTVRPYIKDFPLQVERLKEFTQDFIKKLSVTHANFSLQGVYLTSALQNKSESESNVLDDVINSSQRSIQIFKEPLPLSRAYFIKQLVTHGFPIAQSETTPTATSPSSSPYNWRQYFAVAASITIISCAAIILIRDFTQGMKQTYVIQNELSQYQLTIQQFHDPEEHLIQTSKLLDSLQQATKKVEFKLDLTHLFSFYSTKSQLKATMVYRQALQSILLPEVKNYLQEYLKNPVNKNTGHVYAVLTAYLMLGDASHFQSDFVMDTIRQILPRTIDVSAMQHLMNHTKLALNTNSTPIALDKNTIDQTRAFLAGIPSLTLSYLILKNINNNSMEGDINLGTDSSENTVFTALKNKNKIPLMFTAKAFSAIYTQGVATAAQEAIVGNWILGDIPGMNKSPESIAALTEQLRVAYVNNYIDAWETLLNNINLSKPKTLSQTDLFITNLISNNSPLLQFLQTIYENTYFEPIISTSPKLQSLGLLLDKNYPSDNLLYQIFSGLQSLHQYIQTVLTSDNKSKAAFDIISARAKNLDSSDAITQLRIIAVKSPEPIKNWLDKIANDTWYFLMQEAGHYLDTSWQNKVIRPYQTEIANHYPFSSSTNRDVELRKFANFFGNPGIVLNFYNDYLSPLIDTTTKEWHWKLVDNNKLPFSDETLRQIQHAMRIHRAFFPNGDNKLYVQFTLQPYQLDKYIKNIKLNINDKLISDDTNAVKSPHVFTWPNNNKQTMTAIQLTLMNQKIFYKKFPGDWGWFKLINQSFENAISHKQLIMNFSIDDKPVKYLLFTEGKINPILSLNLRNFHLSQKLTEQK